MTTAGPQYDHVKHGREADLREAQAAAQQAIADAPLVALMSTPEGRELVAREWVWRLFQPIAQGADAVTQRSLGRHDGHVAMWQRLHAACPDLLAKLVAEAISNEGTK